MYVTTHTDTAQTVQFFESLVSTRIDGEQTLYGGSGKYFQAPLLDVVVNGRIYSRLISYVWLEVIRCFNKQR